MRNTNKAELNETKSFEKLGVQRLKDFQRDEKNNEKC